MFVTVVYQITFVTMSCTVNNLTHKALMLSELALSPLGETVTNNTCMHLTYAGFESSDTGDTVKIISQLNPNSLHYWADDNSLWNPNLISPISPDPLMDSTSSFSEPYLQQSTKDALYEDISPVKPIHNRGSSLLLDTTPIQLDLDVLGEDNVFF